MGCGGSKPESTDATPTLTETSAPARRVSSTFTRDGVTLPEGWPEDQPVGKVLLLGGGEAGKSTILKQMHLLYNQDDELDENLFRMWMRRNVIECTKQLVKLAKERELGGLEPADEETILGMDETVATPEQVVKISALWSNGPLKEAMDINRKEPTTWVLDQAGYYLEHVERIFAEDYKPSEVDMVKTRVLTIGVNTVHFTDEVTGPYLMQFVPAAASLISPDDVHLSHTILPWQMIDVGGQRGERRKWLHTLDDVFCVIFTVGLIEYQQVMYEDASMVRTCACAAARLLTHTMACVHPPPTAPHTESGSACLGGCLRRSSRCCSAACRAADPAPDGPRLRTVFVCVCACVTSARGAASAAGAASSGAAASFLRPCDADSDEGEPEPVQAVGQPQVVQQGADHSRPHQEGRV